MIEQKRVTKEDLDLVRELRARGLSPKEALPILKLNWLRKHSYKSKKIREDEQQ